MPKATSQPRITTTVSRLELHLKMLINHINYLFASSACESIDRRRQYKLVQSSFQTRSGFYGCILSVSYSVLQLTDVCCGENKNMSLRILYSTQEMPMLTMQWQWVVFSRCRWSWRAKDIRESSEHFSKRETTRDSERKSIWWHINLAVCGLMRDSMRISGPTSNSIRMRWSFSPSSLSKSKIDINDPNIFLLPVGSTFANWSQLLSLGQTSLMDYLKSFSGWHHFDYSRLNYTRSNGSLEGDLSRVRIKVLTCPNWCHSDTSISLSSRSNLGWKVWTGEKSVLMLERGAATFASMEEEAQPYQGMGHRWYSYLTWIVTDAKA